jgi:hypothetical protein
MVSSGRLDATEEAAVQVAQPIWTENGIVLSSVTYILWLGSSVPAIEVAWTAKPNLIQREGDLAPSNRNAASLYHIDVRTPLRAYWSGEKFDTMAVVLDLSRMTTRDSSLYHPVDEVINATVESILLNAAHGRPPVIKYVDLQVEGGPPEYHRLCKVFLVDRTRARAPR